MYINGFTQNYIYKTKYPKNQPAFMSQTTLGRQVVSTVEQKTKISGFSIFAKLFKKSQKQVQQFEQFLHQRISELTTAPSSVHNTFVIENYQNLLEIVKKNPNQAKRISDLIKTGNFYPGVDSKYLSKDDSDLLDMELCLYEKITKQYGKDNAIDILMPRKGQEFVTKEDIEAKHRIFDRLNPPKSSLEKFADMLNHMFARESLLQTYKRNRLLILIEATNALNEHAINYMLFGNDNPPPSAKQKYHNIEEIAAIATYITEDNKEYIEKIIHERKVPENILLSYLNKNDDDKLKLIYHKVMERYRQTQIINIIAKLDETNMKFLLKLISQPNLEPADEADIFKSYNENNADILNYLINKLKKNPKFQKQIRYISVLGDSINDTNKPYADKWIKNHNANLQNLSAILANMNEHNAELADELLSNPQVQNVNIPKIIANIKTKENSNFIQQLHSTTKIKGAELADVAEAINVIDEAIDKKDYDIQEIIECAKRLREKYSEIMDECGYEIDKKIISLMNAKVITNKPNLFLPTKEGQELFFKTIISNNNPTTENILKTADFDKYKKHGLPLKYSRNEFYKKITEDILKGVNAEDQSEILHFFGIFNSKSTFDGFLQDKDINEIKSCLKSEKGIEAVDKVKAEIIKFLFDNEVQTQDKSLNEVLNALIKGIPSYISIIGKEQHQTHDYSIDIHSLKVLQSAMNNPLYKSLSDESKMVLKLSAILHDIGKRERIIDSGHAKKSAEYAEIILNSLPLKPDVKIRVLNTIRDHHWFEGYSMLTDSGNVIALKCRYPEDFEIYQILAKADIENVNKDFHLNVTGTRTQKEFNQLFAEGMSDIKYELSSIYQKANFVFNTKILNDGAKFPKEKIKMPGGNVIELKVLNLNDYTDKSDMERFGFAPGTTKKDLRFFVHMLKEPTIKLFEETIELLKDLAGNHSWSTSYIKPDCNFTYWNRKFGLIFDVNQSDIAEASKTNVGSGFKKNFNDFKASILSNEEDRTSVRDLFDKTLRKKGIKLNKSEYYELVKYILKKKYLTAIRKDFYVKNKSIKAASVVKSIKQSEHALFEGKDHNEVVVINPKLQGIFAKIDSIKDCPKPILYFAHKYDLPIILMKEKF